MSESAPFPVFDFPHCQTSSCLLYQPKAFVPFLAFKAFFLHVQVIELIKIGSVSSSFKDSYVYNIYIHISIYHRT